MKVSCTLLIVLLAMGCTSLTQQVPSTEPHAMLIIKRTHGAADSDPSERIVRLDGRGVHYVPGAERSYRVAPGTHTVVVEEERRETHVNQYAGVDALVRLAGAAALPAGSVDGGALDKQYETITYSYVTNTISVEPGRVYVLEGHHIVNQTERSNR